MSLGQQVRAADEVRVAVPLAALGFVMVLLPIPDARGGTNFAALTYSELGPLPAALDLVAGVGLIAAGLITWLIGPRPRVGLLAILAGVAWFGPDLFGLARAEPLVRAVGRFLMEPFLLPLVVHLFVALTVRGPIPFSVRVGLVLLYAAAAVVAVLTAATYDPFWDASCIDCAWQNPLLVTSGRGISRTLFAIRAGLEVATGVWLLVRSARAMRRGWLPQAAALAIPAGLLLGAATCLHGVLLIQVPKGDPGNVAYLATFIALAVGVLMLGACMAWVAAQTRRRTLRVREVAASLEVAAQPGAAGEALARALDDADLRVAYWLGDEMGHVDALGRPVDVQPSSGQSVTPVQRAGKLLATVLHADRVEGSALAEGFGPQMLVALDNERLRAARLAQLRELRESRARIVEVGDGVRRRLERDLHDGAQQGLLTVLFDLRLARLTAQRAHLTDRTEGISRAESLAQEVVDELRRQAHGIHPAVLSRSGLVAALVSLSEEAPIPIEVAADVSERAPQPIETAAYQAIVEALRGAVHRGAGALFVTIRNEHGLLVVETRDDAPADVAEPPMSLLDRVGAVGGMLRTAILPGGGTLLRVELPCG